MVSNQSTLSKKKANDDGISGLCNEPIGPLMLTKVPGPKSLEMIKDLDTLQVINNCFYSTVNIWLSAQAKNKIPKFSTNVLFLRLIKYFLNPCVF